MYGEFRLLMIETLAFLLPKLMYYGRFDIETVNIYKLMLILVTSLGMLQHDTHTYYQRFESCD